MRLRRFLPASAALLPCVSASMACVVPISSPQGVAQSGSMSGTMAGGETDASMTTDAPASDAPTTTTVTDGSTSTDGTPITNQSSWTPVTANLAGLSSTCGNFGLVWNKPDEDRLIATVADQGAFANAPNQTNWTPLGTDTDAALDEAGGEALGNRANQMIYDPTNPMTFWEVGNYGPCVYKTTDDGATFSPLGDAMHCDSLGIDFTDASRKTLLAGGHESTVLLKSTDSGMTWTDIGPSMPANAGSPGNVYVVDSQTYIVATWGGSADGIFRTIDGGSTWTQVFSGGGVRAHALVTADAMYFSLNGENNLNGLVKSTDQGATWSLVKGSEAVASGDLVALPGGRLGARSQSQSGVIVSADEGVTWTAVGPSLPFTPTGLWYSTFRNTFYAWYFTCGSTNPVLPDQVQSLSVVFQ